MLFRSRLYAFQSPSTMDSEALALSRVLDGKRYKVCEAIGDRLTTQHLPTPRLYAWFSMPLTGSSIASGVHICHEEAMRTNRSHH